ncbi:hypothetical protein HFP15_02955 [Amycolatopsis sp. K13G38]|uniref:Uncharacterized protein n=1 Tax=Amycolatopsis acididurans TaxID=2724524 RepID=A0ABX1IXB9_9PSEU|nr:hypothetical protein [Amycolatopsis acididurans]NKQ51836.1 hypothetical protein [Amycolatopsis acididurans]
MNRIDWRGMRGTARRRPVLASFSGLIAIFAYAGAAGLITGSIDFGDVINGRLPFGSPVFGGVALAVIVGVPMTAVTYFGSKRDTRTSPAAVVAGTLLVGWIVVEIGFVRSYSWLQPVCAFAGLAVALEGLRDLRVRAS